jgi:organic radical activating enzyme
MRTNYQVSEIFQSIQGEGVLAGIPATFIRLQGCGVNCDFCDTKYTWAKGGEPMTVDEIIAACKPIRPLVVVTGGEPTLYDLDELFVELRDVGQTLWSHDFRIQLETSGQNKLKGARTPDFLTWSPKANLKYDAPKSIKAQAFEVKWVVDDILDLHLVEVVMQEVNAVSARNPVCVLMPEGTPPSQAHVDKAMAWIARHPDWRYGDRLQFRIGVK